MKVTFLTLLFCSFLKFGYCQCQYLDLNNLTDIYNLKLDESEDNLIEKGFDFVETRDDEKLFGKCKTRISGEVSYRQYVLIGNSIMVYTIEDAETYLSVKKIVKEKFKVDPDMSDSKLTYYSDGKILIRFEVLNSQDRPLYFIYLLNA